jgi:hypothetical protein
MPRLASSAGMSSFVIKTRTTRRVHFQSSYPLFSARQREQALLIRALISPAASTAMDKFLQRPLSKYPQEKRELLRRIPRHQHRADASSGSMTSASPLSTTASTIARPMPFAPR